MMRLRRTCVVALGAALAAGGCASEPGHSWNATLEPACPELVREDGDLVARLGTLRVRIDDIVLDRNELASVTLEFVNEGTTDAVAMVDRASAAMAPLRGSIARPLADGSLARVLWQPWVVRDGVSVAPGGRVLLGLARDSVFERFPPAPSDEVVLRIFARTDGADHRADLRFRVTGLDVREEPSPQLR